MFCPNCGKEVPEHVKFCSGCGNPMQSQSSVTSVQPQVVVQHQENVHQPISKSKSSGATIAIILVMMIILALLSVGVWGVKEGWIDLGSSQATSKSAKEEEEDEERKARKEERRIEEDETAMWEVANAVKIALAVEEIYDAVGSGCVISIEDDDKATKGVCCVKSGIKELDEEIARVICDGINFKSEKYDETTQTIKVEFNYDRGTFGLTYSWEPEDSQKNSSNANKGNKEVSDKGELWHDYISEEARIEQDELTLGEVENAVKIALATEEVYYAVGSGCTVTIYDDDNETTGVCSVRSGVKAMDDELARVFPDGLNLISDKYNGKRFTVEVKFDNDTGTFLIYNSWEED